MDATAAVLARDVMAAQMAEDAGMTEQSISRKLLSSEGARVAFLNACSDRGGAAIRAPAQIGTILAHYAKLVSDHPSQLHAKAKLFTDKVRHHAGPKSRVTKVSHLPPAPEPEHAAHAGAWCQQNAEAARPVAARPQATIEALGLDRLQLPLHAVIAPERARAKLAKYWAKLKAGESRTPPVDLVRKLIHTERLPTAVASPGDHYLLPNLGRWVTPTELLTLYRVPHDAALTRVLTATQPRGGISERGIIEALGRAAYPPSVAAVLRHGVGLAGLDTGSKVTFATACSGLSLDAIAMDTIFKDWHYAFASEDCDRLRPILAAAHAGRGLTADHIYKDACSPAACAHAAPSDIWSVGPPCGALSQRNHSPSQESVQTNIDAFMAMLEYPRAHQPALVVIENVPTKAAYYMIVPALLTLEGYSVHVCIVQAGPGDDMERKRMYVMAARKQPNRQSPA